MGHTPGTIIAHVKPQHAALRMGADYLACEGGGLTPAASGLPSAPALPYGRDVTRPFLRRILAATGFRPKRPLIGLDIGSSSVKAVQFTPAGQSYRVAAFATEPLPTGAVAD